MVATTFSTDTPNLVTDIVRNNGVSGNWVWWAFLLTGLLTVFVYAKLWRRSDVNTDFKSAVEKFKQDQKTFIEAVKAYDAARRAINKAFKESVDKALSDAKSLSAPGQTQLQKRQSAVAKQSAVIAATVDRDAAIEALGSPPVAPTQPGKAPSASINKSPQTKKSPTPKK